MSVWHGNLGFAETKESETSPGRWESQITIRHYAGHVERRYVQSYSDGTGTIRNRKVANKITIIEDPFTKAHEDIVWAEYKGHKWHVADVDGSEYPHLVLTLGEVWNEDAS